MGRYCGECNYCVDMYGKMWCSIHMKRADEEECACDDFVEYKEEEE